MRLCTRWAVYYDRHKLNHKRQFAGDKQRLSIRCGDFGGVPFAIASSGNNFYLSDPLNAGGIATVSIPINLSDVTGIHTLINTAWGENASGTLASLTFTFSDSTSFVKTLDGNVDIRDYYQNVFTNSINGTTTQNVFSTDIDGTTGPNEYRLDKQFIDLSAFSSKTLVSMTLTDTGGPNLQRTFLTGITAESSITAVPEPSSFIMAALALVGLLSARRRDSKRNL